MVAVTGLDRLRAISGAWDEWGLGGSLTEIADQIERELREERDRWDDDLSEAQVAWNRVAAVMCDMERHCLGHEGMEDSPVARWARELRGALKSDASDGRDAQNPSWHDPADAADVTSDAPKVTRGPAEDVSMSAYDLLPADEREAIAWVREHGGLSHVKEEWNHSRNLKRPAVLAADGEPLREGETVWDTKGNGPYIIDAIEGDGVVRIKGNDLDYLGADFAHHRPVADTWERLEEDAENDPCSYFGFDGEELCGKCPASGKNCEQTMALDIVRRARALAEKENRNE